MFIQNLAMFFCAFLKEHGALMEKQASHEPLLKSLHYLLLISEVDDVEISKICLEYWNALAADLYRESPFSSTASPLFMSRPANATTPARRGFYQPVLSKVRYIMICKMAKPEEVLVVENDQGEVVREFMKDTDSINMYKNMRETLVYLTHLDYQDTEKIMTEKLANQVRFVQLLVGFLSRLPVLLFFFSSPPSLDPKITPSLGAPGQFLGHRPSEHV